MFLNTAFAAPIPVGFEKKDTGSPTAIEQTKPNVCLPILVHCTFLEPHLGHFIALSYFNLEPHCWQ